MEKYTREELLSIINEAQVTTCCSRKGTANIAVPF